MGFGVGIQGGQLPVLGAGDQCKGTIFDILATQRVQYNHQDSLAISSA